MKNTRKHTCCMQLNISICLKEKDEQGVKPRILETEEGWSWILNNLGLHNKFKAGIDYIVRF